MSYTLESTVIHFLRRRLINDLPEQIRACLNELTDDEIWWRPNEKANSIGNLVLHVCGSTRYYFLYAIQGNPFERNRDAEFAQRQHLPREMLLQYLNELISSCDQVLSNLDPARLMETTDRTGKSTTFLQILLHVLTHVADHTGQIVYIAKLQKEGVIQELWMKTRS